MIRKDQDEYLSGQDSIRGRTGKYKRYRKRLILTFCSIGYRSTLPSSVSGTTTSSINKMYLRCGGKISICEYFLDNNLWPIMLRFGDFRASVATSVVLSSSHLNRGSTL